MSNSITITVDKKELFKSTLEGDLKDSISECIKKLDEITYLRRKLVKTLWSNYDWMIHTFSWEWECEKSPFGWCAYNWKDRPQDDCLFCGQPTERK